MFLSEEVFSRPFFDEQVEYAEPTFASDYVQGLSAPPVSAVSAPGQTWTVMIYQDADDKILEKDIYIDLNEAELVGSSDRSAALVIASMSG